VLETSTPCLARACDYLLGGGASFAADRALALRLDRMYPGLRTVLFSSRSFAAGAIAKIAADGVDQYLDLCSGLPTTPAPHETARAFQPAARVAYVDRDPAVVQHGRALVPAGVRYIAGDLAEPEAILTSGDLAGFIDFSRPVCLNLTLALQVLDPGTARAVCGVLLRALAPGSYLVATAAAGESALPDFTWPGRFTADDLGSFFAGLDLIPPGVHPGAGQPASGALCAVGVKPLASASSVPSSFSTSVPSVSRRTATA
jgi:SAM-dependent methyltransferase